MSIKINSNIMLAMILKTATLKGVTLSEPDARIWFDQIREDVNSGEINIEKAIEALGKLSKTKIYRFDYSDFYELATSKDKKDNKELIQDEWNDVLMSAKKGGTLKISSASAKALNSIGGMMRIRDAKIHEVGWLQKDFERNYPEDPYSVNDDFRCTGLQAPIFTLVKQPAKMLKS